MKILSILHRAALTLFLLPACLPVTQAQRNVIKFDPDNCDSFTHGFRNVIVLDQRPDTLGTIGYVKLGLSNRPVKVETADPLGQEIAAYYRALSAKATSNSGKDLVVVIHDLMATEDGMGLTKEFAFFRYRAEYFTGKDDAYTSLGMIDTTVEIGGFDVTQKLLRSVDACLCSFCQALVDNSLHQLSDTVYTLADLGQVELLRRLKMRAYQNRIYPDGIYPTWQDFLQLKHIEDKKVLEYKKRHFVGQGTNKKGKLYKFTIPAMNPDKPINPGRVIVFQGIPYRTFEGRFYPLVFSGDQHFHFNARTSRFKPGSSAFIPVGGMVGGAIGIGTVMVLSGGGRREEYDFTINWRTGKFVPGRQIGGKVKKDK